MVEVFPKDIMIRIRYHGPSSKDGEGPYLEMYKLLENKGDVRHAIPLGYTSIEKMLDTDPNLSLESIINRMNNFLNDR